MVQHYNGTTVQWYNSATVLTTGSRQPSPIHQPSLRLTRGKLCQRTIVSKFLFEKLFVILLLIFPEQKQEDRRHALEKMGISVQSSGIKVSTYDNVSRNLTKCWSQLEAKVTPTSDDLLTSNLFYSRTTIVRNMKFEFEGILIIISI